MIIKRIRRTAHCLWHVNVRDQRDKRHLSRWVHSIWRSTGPLDDAWPWVTFEAADWLEEHLTPEMTVFEFGSGGSTVFFAQRVRQVVSVEHNPLWYERVRERLEQLQLHNCDYTLHEPQPVSAEEPADRYRSTRAEYAGQTFEDYARSIDAQPDSHFDVVFVDGRARMACVHHAIQKVTPGGFLILDNSDRAYYQEAYDRLQGCECRDLDGIGPYGIKQWRTTVWQMPEQQTLRKSA